MKVCKYCRTENPDGRAQCPSCGGGEFQNKCNNCGSIVSGLFCQSCGTKTGDAGKKCPRCSKVFFSPACPECGWKPGEDITRNVFPNANQTPANATYVANMQPHITQNPPKKKMNTFLLVLLWIFFLPIMLCILIGKSSLPKATKIILIAFVIILTLLIGSSQEGEAKTIDFSQIQTGYMLY